jgi:hypothetical protein
MKWKSYAVVVPQGSDKKCLSQFRNYNVTAVCSFRARSLAYSRDLLSFQWYMKCVSVLNEVQLYSAFFLFGNLLPF